MLIPNDIKEFDSNGERILFYKLKNDYSCNQIYALHSVFLAKHLKSISGEIDFLVLYPNHGIFAIEVKHGRVERNNGIWSFINKEGKKDTSTKGPFRQINDTMHSIRKWILDNCSENKRDNLEKLLFGTGVVFSGLYDYIEIGTEGFQWQILYRENIHSNNLIHYFNNLSKGWHKERSTQNWYNFKESKPTKKDCEYIVKLLRGDFLFEYTILNKIRDNKILIQEFTNIQMEVYSHLQYNDRNLIQGAAGTGKTILAYQLAIELLKQGKRVMFLCFNKLLGYKISNDFKKEDIASTKSYFGNYHGFLLTNSQVKVIDKNDFYKNVLPLEFLLQNEYKFKAHFDYLILDEAQDLINDTNLLVFDHILKNGLNEGLWTFFGDFEKQNLFEEKDNINLLKQFNYSRYKPLKTNCRNTFRINNQNKMLTGVKYDDCLNNSIESEKVSIRFPSKTNQIRLIDDILTELLKSGLENNNITILYPFKNFETKLLLESKYNKLMETSSINFNTIHSFKGLESDIVILTGFNEIESSIATSLLYVGISRAIFKLYLILDKSLESQYQNLITLKL